MPNAAQLHLAINHLPVVGALFACGTLLAGLLLKNHAVRRTGMALMVVAALTGAAAYFTGDPAEHVLKNAAPAAFNKPLVHEHEEAAEFAVIAIGLAGVCAAAALFFSLQPHHHGTKYETWATAAAYVTGFFALLVLLRTAHLGGLIHHEELRSVAAPTAQI